MENKNKNEELQSRREFFKSAAKAALPVLGAVVLSSLPISVQAAEMGCNFGCSYTCDYACASDCLVSCQGGCNNSCYGSCRGTCNAQAYY